MPFVMQVQEHVLTMYFRPFHRVDMTGFLCKFNAYCRRGFCFNKSNIGDAHEKSCMHVMTGTALFLFICLF